MLKCEYIFNLSLQPHLLPQTLMVNVMGTRMYALCTRVSGQVSCHLYDMVTSISTSMKVFLVRKTNVNCFLCLIYQKGEKVFDHD